MCTVLEIDGPRCNMDIQSHSKAQLRQQFLRHLAETGFANAEAGEDGGDQAKHQTISAISPKTNHIITYITNYKTHTYYIHILIYIYIYINMIICNGLVIDIWYLLFFGVIIIGQHVFFE